MVQAVPETAPVKDDALPARRLAAIMFTDIVGYTAIMGLDEAKGVQAREKHRALVQSQLGQFNGRWVEEIGDESFTVFPSALDAVRCALAIRASAGSSDPPLSLRIGIHMGDVLERDGRLMGDAVNVAARVRTLAEPGAIVVSERVGEEVRNQPGIGARYLGEKQLKNVSRPVRLYALEEGAPRTSRNAARRRRWWMAAAAFAAAVAILIGVPDLRYGIATAAALTIPRLLPPPIEQTIGFATTSDGVRIAYGVTGKGAATVLAPGWMTHLERGALSPLYSGDILKRASIRGAFVRMDQRGMGLSQRGVTDFSLEARVRDLEAVVDALGLERFFLSAASAGCAVAIAYAGKHPGRVVRMALYGGFLRRPHGAQRDAMATLIREGWGKDNPATRQFFTTMFMPDASEIEMRMFNEFQRISATPEDAAAWLETPLDVSVLAREARVPTIVFHRVGDAQVPYENGLELASAISGARFVSLPGRNHALLLREPELAQMQMAIGKFFEEAGENAVSTLDAASLPAHAKHGP